VKNKLAEIKRLFPDSVIKTEAGGIEYFFENDQLIIRTPDRSSRHADAVDNLKHCGLSGIWRSKKEGPRAK
jgi:hypothetical protein